MSKLSTLAGIPVGPGHPTRFMGVINVSPESFFKGSVHIGEAGLARAAEQMEADGADFVDVGAMSTAPYLKTQIPEKEEARRLGWAVKIIRKACQLPISIDAHRPRAVEAGLEAGGRILNDITGLAGDANLVRLAKYADGLVLMAHPAALQKKRRHRPIEAVAGILATGVTRAVQNGIPLHKIAVDPGIGFFRNEVLNWWQWDLDVLQNLERLQNLGRPILIGLSRKSFIGQILGGRDADHRLPGSLGATILTVIQGAGIVRTHDVAQTRDAVRVAEAILRGAKTLPAEKGKLKAQRGR